MRFSMFSIFDSASATFSRPFMAPNRGSAIRGFADAVNGEDKSFSAHPEDYHLYEVGAFDDVAGSVEPLKAGPVQVVRGVDLVK